jgi:hypothetical protein
MRSDPRWFRCGPWPSAAAAVRASTLSSSPVNGHYESGPQTDSRRSAYAGGRGRAKGKNIPLSPGSDDLLLARPQGSGPALRQTDPPPPRRTLDPPSQKGATSPKGRGSPRIRIARGWLAGNDVSEDPLSACRALGKRAAHDHLRSGLTLVHGEGQRDKPVGSASGAAQQHGRAMVSPLRTEFRSLQDQ